MGHREVCREGSAGEEGLWRVCEVVRKREEQRDALAARAALASLASMRRLLLSCRRCEGLPFGKYVGVKEIFSRFACITDVRRHIERLAEALHLD